MLATAFYIKLKMPSAMNSAIAWSCRTGKRNKGL